MDPKTYKFDTISLHGGYMPSKNAGSDKYLFIKPLLIYLMMLIMLQLYLI